MISLLVDDNEFIHYMANIDVYDENAINEAKKHFKYTTIMGVHLTSLKDANGVIKNGLIPYSDDMEYNRELLNIRLQSYGYNLNEIRLISDACIKRLKEVAILPNNVINRVCFSFDEECITHRGRNVFLKYLGGGLVAKAVRDNNIMLISGKPYAVYIEIPFNRFYDWGISSIINICKLKELGIKPTVSNSSLDCSVEGIIEPEYIKKVEDLMS